ncbi:MAG: hypothetical protein KAQ76_01125 [Elusimicrobiales bacterium]|nr:hypothetical protein [Elusimicrobiales bacterium]
MPSDFNIFSAECFNLIEAILWIGIGLGLYMAHKSFPVKEYKNIVITAILFLLFGVSDIIEIYSGAWWSSWWLLTWKISNGIALLYFTFKLLKSEKLKRN